MSREIVERFPIQDGPSVPWEFMAPHEAQARKNHGQTLEGLAKRGGLGCAEAWVIVRGLKHMDILHEEHKRKWIELAERVNREWSIERLLADERKPMKCGHPKACWIHEDSSDPDKRGVFYEKGWCSACAERKRVREMCIEAALGITAEADVDSVVQMATINGRKRAAVAIRQLDLTKDLAPSTEEDGPAPS